ncbi:MAG: hypothetical protein RL417_670 [Pseudomonadota bacterium]
MANHSTRVLLIGGPPGLFGALQDETRKLGYTCDWLEIRDDGDQAAALRALSLYSHACYFLWSEGIRSRVLEELGALKISRPVIVVAPSHDTVSRERFVSSGALDAISVDTIGSLDFRIALNHGATRKRLDDVRSSRADYESLITIISSNFTHLAPDEIDRGINEALAVLGRFSGVDNAFLFLCREDNSALDLSHEWRAERAASAGQLFSAGAPASLAWFWDTLNRGETIKIVEPVELVPHGGPFAQLLITQGIKSIIVVPLIEGRRLIGFLGLFASRFGVAWSADVASLLKIVAETFLNALRRRRDQQALIESEHRFRTLLENLNEGVVYCDRGDIILHVSPKACEMLGYSASEMVGEHIERLIIPDESREILQERTARRWRGLSDSYEIKLNRKDGTSLWVEMNASPVRDSEGTIIGSIGGFIDITERKRVREALRLSEERLRHYFDNSVIGIAISSPTKGFLEVNDYLCQLHGYSREELSHMTWVDLTHPDDRINDVGWFDRLARGEIDSYELDKRFVHKEGYVWNARLVVGAVRRPDRSLDYIIALAQDITAQRRAQSHLQTQAEFYRQLIDANPNLIFACDYGGSFTLANKAFADISGLPVDAIIGKRNSDFVADPVLAKRYDADNDTIIRTGAPILKAQEKIIDARTGKERWFQAIKTPLLSPDGQIPYILCVASEITDVKQAQDEASTLQRQLIQSHKMEAIGQLAAGVAHDLNNALAAVVGHLQLLQNEVSEQGRGSFHTALSGCERASSLIQQLLGFSRQGKYNPQVIRARDVVTNTVEFLGKVIDKDIEVRIGEDSEGLSIHGDFSQLQQVVTNLILNATQAISGPGAITFDFGRREVLHPERYNPRAHTGFFVTLTVSDTGCGIPEEHLDKIFEPFFTTKRDREGTGLGLSMVYGIMQNHSGWVEVDSTIGGGTRFTLVFPQALGVAASTPEDGVETTPLLKPRRLASGHVVVIDDEPVLVDLARQFLANAGVEVTGFTDPNEALRWYRREWRSVDIIVLDMKMPKVDGPACFRELRDINPAARVVVMSGFVQDTAAQKLMEAGVAHFFEKPLRYPELVAWIVEELARHQQIAV